MLRSVQTFVCADIEVCAGLRYDDPASADYANSLLDALFKLDIHQTSIDSLGISLRGKAEKKTTNALSLETSSSESN